MIKQLSNKIADNELLTEMEALQIKGGSGDIMPLTDTGCTNGGCRKVGCNIDCSKDDNAGCFNAGCNDCKEIIKTGGSAGCIS
ncbi:MAG: hypothetical protein HDS68_05260 [Bacteroidales bacterium]|nr:hypothetical protein [Bacteroidales bacterium]